MYSDVHLVERHSCVLDNRGLSAVLFNVHAYFKCMGALLTGMHVPRVCSATEARRCQLLDDWCYRWL